MTLAMPPVVVPAGESKSVPFCWYGPGTFHPRRLAVVVLLDDRTQSPDLIEHYDVDLALSFDASPVVSGPAIAFIRHEGSPGPRLTGPPFRQGRTGTFEVTNRLASRARVHVHAVLIGHASQEAGRLVGTEPGFVPFRCERCGRRVESQIEDCPQGAAVPGNGTEPHVRPPPVQLVAVAKVLSMLSEGASESALIHPSLLPDHIQVCPDCRALEVPRPDCSSRSVRPRPLRRLMGPTFWGRSFAIAR